jgi:anti-sigma regulatory factor (Ser/Thr protein kinase)/ABC-type transporter Mla MlaB component
MGRCVTLTGEFGTACLDMLCMQLTPLTSLTDPELVSIDLSALEGMCASALAVLVSALRTARVDGLCNPFSQFNAPRSCPELTGEFLRALVEHRDDRQPQGTVEAACGCEPFSSIDGVVRARETLLQWISAEAKLSEQAQATVRKLIWDLAQNVLAHAEIGGGVAAARVNLHDQTLELAVADRGIGIRESLARSEVPNVSDDVSALRAALQPGVTSEPGTGKGMGLYLANRVLVKNEGTLMVRSGNARLEQPSQVELAAPLPNFKGTLVTVVARLDRPLDHEAVDRELSRPQGVAT